MNVGGEIIQLSFGPASNAITSHLCNLQGLSCTTSSDPYYDNNTPLCDPYITHSVQQETYVPRVLFVDGKNCFNPWPDPNRVSQTIENQPSTTGTANAVAYAAAATNVSWGGKVDVHRRLPQYEYTTKHASANTNTNAITENMEHQFNNVYRDKSHNSNYNQLNQTQQNAFSNFQQTSSSSLSSSSRYHASQYKHVSSQFIYTPRIASQDGRTMDWGDDGDEEEEEDEGEEDMDGSAVERREFQERKRRNQKENEMQFQLTNAWDTFLGTATDSNANADDNHNANTNTNANASTNGNETKESTTTIEENTTTKIATAEEMRNYALSALQWMNYFMPPHPHQHMYSAPLPFERENRIHTQSQSSNNQKTMSAKQVEQAMLYSFHAGKNPSTSSSSFCSSNEMSSGITREWREDFLWDKIRKWMEDCDAIKGFQVTLDADEAFFGGLASSVLEELGDECRSAGRFSILVHDGDEFVDLAAGGDNGGGVNAEGADQKQEEDGKYWRSENKAVGAFRGELNSGLLLHGITEHSDLILPLSMSKCWQSLHKKNNKDKNLFEASAAAALALETMSLPFRLAKGLSKSKNRSKVGIGSGYFQGSGNQSDDDMFPTADKLSYHEFIASLKPSNRHIVTEMSCLAHPASPDRVHQSILQGTSIERRQQEEEMHRNRNNYYSNRRSRGRDVDPGLWMEDEGNNMGLLTSLSPIGAESTSSRSLHHHFALATSFRPLPSEVGDTLTTYTASLMEGMSIRYRPQSIVATVVNQSFQELTGGNAYSAGTYWGSIFGPQGPTMQPLCNLGNTTRMHDHLKITARGLKSALSRKHKGYLRRDGMAGLAPEGEDCEEAMEACLTLRDVYEPPSMDSDDEGVYFDDN